MSIAHMTEMDHVELMLERLYDLGYEIGAAHSTVEGRYSILLMNKNVQPTIEEQCVGNTFKDCLEEAIAFHNDLHKSST